MRCSNVSLIIYSRYSIPLASTSTQVLSIADDPKVLPSQLTLELRAQVAYPCRSRVVDHGSRSVCGQDFSLDRTPGPVISRGLMHQTGLRPRPPSSVVNLRQRGVRRSQSAAHPSVSAPSHSQLQLCASNAPSTAHRRRGR